jgi:hypothetical protein
VLSATSIFFHFHFDLLQVVLIIATCTIYSHYSMNIIQCGGGTTNPTHDYKGNLYSLEE